MDSPISGAMAPQMGVSGHRFPRVTLRRVANTQRYLHRQQHRSIAGLLHTRAGKPRQRCTVRAESAADRSSKETDNTDGGPLAAIQQWWRNLTGGNNTEDTESSATAQDAQAAHLAQPAAFSKDTAGSGAPKVKHAAPKEQEVSQPEKATDPLSMARTAPAPGNWTAAGRADDSGSSTLNGSSPGKVAAAASHPPAAAAGSSKASAGKQDAGAVWGDQPKPASDWDGSEPAKASAVGYAIMAGMLLLGLLVTSWLFKGLGHLRSRQSAKAASPVGMLPPQPQHREAAATIDTHAAGKEQPAEAAASSAGAEGDFKAYDRHDLDDMREAGEKQEASAIAQARRGTDATQAAHLADEDAGKPKVWLPGEGWVVVEPLEEQQDEAGYAADDEVSDRDAAAAGEAGQEGTQAASEGASRDAEHTAEGEGVAQEKEGKYVAGGTPHDSDEQQSATAGEQDRSGAPSSAAPADEPESSRELPTPQQAQQKQWHFEFSRQLPPPQLPAPAEVERPASAVDAASLRFPTDLSVGTLRDRASVALRASLAAGDASHRAASYSAAASAAASRAASAAERAAGAASHAQAAADVASKDELEEALARVEAAQQEAQEAEGRAAAAAALTTAHQEVATTQAGAAEQAADTTAQTQPGLLTRGRRTAGSAWYATKDASQRAGRSLSGAGAAAWLWLAQAWQALVQCGHRASLLLQSLWHWLMGRFSHARLWVTGLHGGGAPGPA